MADFTPGPWHADGDYIQAGTCVPIAKVSIGLPGDERQANAKLLAAAPDLLAACEAMFVRLHREQGGQENSPWASSLAHLRRVIAQSREEK